LTVAVAAVTTVVPGVCGSGSAAAEATHATTSMTEPAMAGRKRRTAAVFLNAPLPLKDTDLIIEWRIPKAPPKVKEHIRPCLERPAPVQYDSEDLS
jgi:hypothetical protein